MTRLFFILLFYVRLYPYFMILLNLPFLQWTQSKCMHHIQNSQSNESGKWLIMKKVMMKAFCDVASLTTIIWTMQKFNIFNNSSMCSYLCLAMTRLPDIGLFTFSFCFHTKSSWDFMSEQWIEHKIARYPNFHIETMARSAYEEHTQISGRILLAFPKRTAKHETLPDKKYINFN